MRVGEKRMGSNFSSLLGGFVRVGDSGTVKRCVYSICHSSLWWVLVPLFAKGILFLWLIICGYACFFSTSCFFRVTCHVRIRGSGKRIIFFTRADDHRVRCFRTAFRRFVMDSIIRLNYHEIFLQINYVGTIRADPFRRRIYLSFSSSR